jgi:phosphoribosylpyrophosphate synthetase
VVNPDDLIFYSGTLNYELGERTLGIVSARLNRHLDFTDIYFNEWADDERGFELENPDKIAGKHIVIFVSVTDDEEELQMYDMVTACKYQYFCATVTVVMSFLRYRRQDHPDYTNEITRLRWFMKRMKDAGVDYLIVCDPHNVKNTSDFSNEFGLQLTIADPSHLFAAEVMPLILSYGPENVIWYSPDYGSVERAIIMARLTKTRVLASDKKRIDGVVTSLGNTDGLLERIHKEFGTDIFVTTDMTAVAGLHVFMREDELDSGATSSTTAVGLRRSGALSVRLIATHTVCSNSWKRRLLPRKSDRPFDHIYFGNTRPRGPRKKTVYQMRTGGLATTVDVSPALANSLISVIERLS